MKLLLKRRADVATNNACNILSSSTNHISKELKANTAAAVRNRIDEKFIVSESGSIIVTHIGYVTMAILSGHAIYRKELLIIPGVDEKNQSGYLVLRSDYVPYHSLAKDIEGAVAETEAAHSQAEKLLEYFGNRKALKEAALKAPWYQISTMDDVKSAGLCQWGTMSFLNRIKIASIACQTGLPCILFRHAGGYGNRVIASTTRRLETTQHVKQASSGRPNKLNRRNT